MKKETSYKLPAGLRALTAVLILALLIGLCGCGAGNGTKIPEDPEAAVDAAAIVEGSHPRETDYLAVFKTHALTVGPLSLHMEDRIYDEDLLRGLAKEVLGDLAKVKTGLGVEPGAVKVYLVKEPIGGVPMRVGTHVFCAPADVSSDAFRNVLFAAAYDLSTTWQQTGLTEYLFGEADDAGLQAYYADGAHPLTASCSALHLSSVLSDPDTVGAARATARSLTAFILARDGFDVFRALETPADILPAWAEALGISPAPVLPKNCGELAGLTLEVKSDSSCTLRMNNFTVLLTGDSWLREPDGLYQWFSDFLAGMELELDQIRTEAPSAAEIISQRFAENINIYFTNRDQISMAYPASNRINLSRNDAIWHEMGHILLMSDDRDEFQWLNEAVAEHFSVSATALYAPTQYISNGLEAYEEIFASYLTETEAAPDDLVFHECVWTLYQRFRDPQQTENDDLEAYKRAYGICSILLDGKITRTQFRTMYDRTIAYGYGRPAGRPETDPMGLTYSQSLVLFEYLCGMYGTDAVINAYLNSVSLEKAFGITYKQLFVKARSHYEMEYMKLLPIE